MRCKFLLSVEAVILIAAAAVYADPVITIDKNGDGYSQDPPLDLITDLPHSNGVDPTDATNGEMPLIYRLPNIGSFPYMPTAGDVLLTNPGTGQDEDLLRWTTDGSTMGGGLLIVYSQPGPDLADVGLPGTFQSNLLTISEQTQAVGPGGVDQATGLFDYTPLSGQPGYFDGIDVSYNFTDNVSVPEPALLPLAGLFWFGLRRGRRRQTP